MNAPLSEVTVQELELLRQDVTAQTVEAISFAFTARRDMASYRATRRMPFGTERPLGEAIETVAIGERAIRLLETWSKSNTKQEEVAREYLSDARAYEQLAYEFVCETLPRT